MSGVLCTAQSPTRFTPSNYTLHGALALLPSSGFPDVRKLGVSKFRTFRKSEGTDRLLLNIDVDADLAPAFNWNVKQLFAFVVAEYETKTNPVNQARSNLRGFCLLPLSFII